MRCNFVNSFAGLTRRRGSILDGPYYHYTPPVHPYPDSLVDGTVHNSMKTIKHDTTVHCDKPHSARRIAAPLVQQTSDATREVRVIASRSNLCCTQKPQLGRRLRRSLLTMRQLLGVRVPSAPTPCTPQRSKLQYNWTDLRSNLAAQYRTASHQKQSQGLRGKLLRMHSEIIDRSL